MQRTIASLFNIQKNVGTPEGSVTHNLTSTVTSNATTSTSSCTAAATTSSDSTARHTCSSPYPDIGTLDTSELAKYGVKLTWQLQDCNEFVFPSMACSLIGSKNRKFNGKLICECAIPFQQCLLSIVLFPKKGVKEKTFSTNDGSNWSNISKLRIRHTKEGATHNSCVNIAENFLYIAGNQCLYIVQHVNISHQEHVERRDILLVIVELSFAADKTFLFVTTDQEMETILAAGAKDKPELALHLERCSTTAKYISPKIQNELMDDKGLVRDCNESSCFSFIVDECCDKSHMGHIVLYI